MSTVTIYAGSTFLIEEYPDGVCVLMQDGEAPLYADALDWFDNWGDDIDLSIITARQHPCPEVPLPIRTLPGGSTVQPVRFKQRMVGGEYLFPWGFAVADAMGNLTVTNLCGQVLYPMVENGYCLTNSPQIQALAQSYCLNQETPATVPRYVADALEGMFWQPLVMGIPRRCQLPGV
ncbi:hypothetical protein [Anthocerotibacter panamensis]|uniref:hypothetical protein n=1 Tax=Anthocerotibacter panamensis TaxID=2857077 RepID=UPI001C4054BC|nr:hypothetical protein [Anthocerotibacter panamensis]